MRRALVLLAVAGCGRIGFDARSAAGDGGGGGGGDAPATDGPTPALGVLALDRVDPGEVITDYPLLVTLDDAHLDRARLAPDASDLRFFDTSGVLASEIASVGPPLQAWVRVPEISGTTTKLAFSYGAPPTETSLLPVWSSDYVAVWHLDGTGTASDATGRFDATAAGAPTATAGLVGGAQLLDGTGQQYFVVADTTALTPSEFTLSAWFRPTALPTGGGYFALLSREVGDTSDDDLYLGLVGARAVVTCQTASGEKDVAGGAPTAGQWGYYAATAKGTAEDLYFDGQAAGNGPLDGALLSDARAIFLGADRNSASASLVQPDGDYVEGAIDEIRVQQVARSAAWIAFDHTAMLDGVISY